MVNELEQSFLTQKCETNQTQLRKVSTASFCKFERDSNIVLFQFALSNFESFLVPF